MSLYCCHQPEVPAAGRGQQLFAYGLVGDPYRLSRSARSRSLASVRPRSRRLILEWVARIASAACAVVRLLASRSRRNRVPSAIRGTVGSLGAPTSVPKERADERAERKSTGERAGGLPPLLSVRDHRCSWP